MYITSSQRDQLPDGVTAQLFEHCTGITEVMRSNPVQAWDILQDLISQLLELCLTSTINHVFISFFAVQTYDIAYIHLYYKKVCYTDKMDRHEEDSSKWICKVESFLSPTVERREILIQK